MLNIKLKHVVFFLGLIMASFQAMPAAAASSSLAEDMGYLLGLDLKEPLVRVSIRDYISGRGEEICKLAIGAGHIADPMALHPAYKPGGSNCLTESIQGSGDYKFHGHEGWYTFSAETDAAFGSDMVGNIRVASHQYAVLSPNIWGLVLDESYHPHVLSAPGLPLNIFRALKKGGRYVFTLPIEQARSHRKNYWVIGHDCPKKPETREFNEKFAYRCLSSYYLSVASIESALRQEFTAIGFSSVKLYESISLTSLTDITTSEEIASGSFIKPLCPQIERAMGHKIDYIIQKRAHPLLSIDPIFAHTTGMYYVVATK